MTDPQILEKVRSNSRDVNSMRTVDNSAPNEWLNSVTSQHNNQHVPNSFTTFINDVKGRLRQTSVSDYCVPDPSLLKSLASRTSSVESQPEVMDFDIDMEDAVFEEDWASTLLGRRFYVNKRLESDCSDVSFLEQCISRRRLATSVATYDSDIMLVS